MIAYPTMTPVDGWATKVPNVAAHLNLDADTASYVQGSVGETMELGGFVFDIPAGAIIDLIEVVQDSLNTVTQQSHVTRFALKVAGVEMETAQYDVSNTDPQVQTAPFVAPAITRDQLVAGLLTVEKFTINAGTGENPPIPHDGP